MIITAIITFINFVAHFIAKVITSVTKFDVKDAAIVKIHPSTLPPIPILPFIYSKYSAAFYLLILTYH